jgi:hypothetical protein
MGGGQPAAANCRLPATGGMHPTCMLCTPDVARHAGALECMALGWLGRHAACAATGYHVVVWGEWLLRGTRRLESSTSHSSAPLPQAHCSSWHNSVFVIRRMAALHVAVVSAHTAVIADKVARRM